MNTEWRMIAHPKFLGVKPTKQKQHAIKIPNIVKFLNVLLLIPEFDESLLEKEYTKGINEMPAITKAVLNNKKEIIFELPEKD